MFRRRAERPVINPFLPVPDRSPIEDDGTDHSDEVFGDRLRLVGPQVPIEVPLDLSGPLVLPCESVGEAAPAFLLWIVSLHGGSGATALTGVLGALAATAPLREKAFTPRRVTESVRRWPCGPGPAVASTVLLVARAHAAGLVAAEAAARQWATGRVEGVHLLGLVLVDDAPRLTEAQNAYMRQVASTVPNCWHLPWQEAWREIREPGFEDASRRVRRIGADIINCAREVRTCPSPRR